MEKTGIDKTHACFKAIKQPNQNVIMWWKVFNKLSRKGGQMIVAVTEKQTEKQ